MKNLLNPPQVHFQYKYEKIYDNDFHNLKTLADNGGTFHQIFSLISCHYIAIKIYFLPAFSAVTLNVN